MRICKRCGCEVIDDELKYCSRCGADLSKKENVLIDKTSSGEKDTSEFEIVEVKPKRRIICFILQFFLGFTGAPFFYIGFIVRGFAWIGFNLAIAALSLIFKHIAFLVSIIFINIVMSFGWLFKSRLIDSKGNELK